MNKNRLKYYHKHIAATKSLRTESLSLLEDFFLAAPF